MSYGDDIMTTGLVRELKTRFPESKILIGDGKKEYLSPVFLHNPGIDHGVFTKKDDEVIWLKDFPGHRPYIDYSRSTGNKIVFNPRFTPVPGNLYFTAPERAAAKKSLAGLRSFVVIEPNVRGMFAAANRDWGFEKWQAVADGLRGKTVFVQLGAPGARSLKGVRRIVTQNFRAACAILSSARLFTGTEGGLHHAAAALGVGGVVVFGGRVSPETTGYAGHANLYAGHRRSPCGRTSPCDHCKKCMKSISIEKVIRAIMRQL